MLVVTMKAPEPQLPATYNLLTLFSVLSTFSFSVRGRSGNAFISDIYSKWGKGKIGLQYYLGTSVLQFF